jgi:hypothetical protein
MSRSIKDVIVFYLGKHVENTEHIPLSAVLIKVIPPALNKDSTLLLAWDFTRCCYS